MLTLWEKFQLGIKGEWIGLARAAVLNVASDVTHEKPSEINFGATQEAALNEAQNGTAVRAEQQIACHELRVAKARQIIASPQQLEQSAQLAAQLLASAMAEDVAKVDANQGTAVASLMRAFLALDPEQNLNGQQADLDAVILATVRGGWSALAGYNVHYEIPKALTV